MRLPLPALGAFLFAMAAAAAAEGARSGYAFENPRVLAQQRLFGIAHGVRLLAAACREMPAADAARTAYAAWRQRQQAALDAAAADLSRYHFGTAADEAGLVKVLHLRTGLDYAPDSAELQAACATLPQALAKPRYDLGERLRLEEMMARLVVATEVEARDHYCSGKLSGLAHELHAARYRLWREINEPAIQQASTALARDWPDDAPAASFAAWRTALRRDTKAGGSAADCGAFSETLKHPASALRNVFLPPLSPPPPGTP
ncbi:MAG: hypothetical protein HZC24_13595 [Rhodocyclales bacterium]|nr:hypothetical protein [Rhodocyclales bacterium]